MSPDQRHTERIKRARTDEMRAQLGLPSWQWQERGRTFWRGKDPLAIIEALIRTSPVRREIEEHRNAR